MSNVSVGRLLPLALGLVTLGSAVLLFAQDAAPELFPARSHRVLAALALAGIAVAYLVYQWARRPALMELAKAVLLAAAFLFWAANQFWPSLPQAALFNDIAIGLFVLDVFLVIAGSPPTSKESPASENSEERCGRACCHCVCRCTNCG